MYKLMIKSHPSGLKYLCCTQKSGTEYDRYFGSGTRWNHHLKKHGREGVTTHLVYQSNDRVVFSAVCSTISKFLNVVESDAWANLVHEEGFMPSKELIEWIRKDKTDRKLTEEHKQNISKSSKGVKKTSQTVERMRRAQKGRVISEEHKEKMKLNHSGMSGRKHSAETKEKMRLAALSRKKK